jgi:hypothetical protein
MNGARLRNADLGRAIMGGTVLAACADLAQALGLADVSHAADSSIDIATLRVGLDRFPGQFLEGLGLTAEELERWEDTGLRTGDWGLGTEG